MLEFAGIDSRRFQMSWVSASEGQRFGEVIADVVEEIRELGPQENMKREGLI